MARLFIVFLLFVISSANVLFAQTTFNEVKATEYMKNMEKQLLALTSRMNKHQEEIANQNTRIAQQNTKFAVQNTKFAVQNTKIANQDTQFATINTRFAELDRLIDMKMLKPEVKQNQSETCACEAGKPINIALMKPAAQSSTYGDDTADKAVDGNAMMSYSSRSCAHTKSYKDSWWCVDLLRDYNISTIKITNRNTLEERLAGFNVRFSSTGSCDGDGFNSAKVCYTEPGEKKGLYSVKGCDDGRQMSGRYVFIGGPGQYLTICEVEIYN